jgi:type I restriction enzyme S subunit
VRKLKAKSQACKTVRVAEIADSIQYGHTASAISRKDGPRFLRITDIQNGAVDWDAVPSCDIAAEDVPKYRLSEGDLVFARTGATTGKSYLIRKCPDAVFASYLIRIRASRDVDPRYLAYFFQSPEYWQQIEQGKRGIGQPNVNGKTLGEVKLPLRQLDQQQRIVAEIEKQFTRLDAGLASLKRVQTALKRYRASVLKAACEGRLVPTEAELARKENRTYETGEQLLQRILTERRHNLQRRGNYEEPAAPKTAELPPPPDCWTWATVEQLLKNDSGLGYGILKPGGEDANGVPMVRVMDIGDGKLAGTEMMKVKAKLSEEFNRTVLQSGDILLAVMATVGRCMVVPDDLVGANVNRAIAVIKPTRLVPSKFLELAIRSPRLQQLFQKNKIGSAQPRINLSDLRTYCLPLPPLAEQVRILAEVERRLSVIEELEALASTELQRATRLRQSILQNAFTGRFSSNA